MQSNDPTHPHHYEGDGKVKADDALRSMLSHSKQPAIVVTWWSMAFKYLWRWHLKNGVQDLDKAIDCIERMKNELKD